jgi:hypothetical protein
MERGDVGRCNGEEMKKNDGEMKEIKQKLVCQIFERKIWRGEEGE